REIRPHAVSYRLNNNLRILATDDGKIGTVVVVPIRPHRGSVLVIAGDYFTSILAVLATIRPPHPELMHGPLRFSARDESTGTATGAHRRTTGHRSARTLDRPRQQHATDHLWRSSACRS